MAVEVNALHLVNFQLLGVIGSSGGRNLLEIKNIFDCSKWISSPALTGGGAGGERGPGRPRELVF